MYVVLHPAEAARANAEADRARDMRGWAEIMALKIQREKQQRACVMRPIWDKAEDATNG